MPGLPGSRNDNYHRCSEQNRRKAVTQSYGATAAHAAMPAGPPASTSRVRWRPAPFLGRRRGSDASYTARSSRVVRGMPARTAAGNRAEPESRSGDRRARHDINRSARFGAVPGLRTHHEWRQHRRVRAVERLSGFDQLGGGPDEVPLVSTAKVYKRKIVALLLSPSTVTLPPGGIQQFSTDAIRAIGDTVIISPTYSATGGSIVS